MNKDAQDIIAMIAESDLQKAIEDRPAGVFHGGSATLNNHLSIAGSKAPFSQLSKKTNKNELRFMFVSKGYPSSYLTISPSDVNHLLA
jgi:hypothetical protein